MKKNPHKSEPQTPASIRSTKAETVHKLATDRPEEKPVDPDSEGLSTGSDSAPAAD